MARKTTIKTTRKFNGKNYRKKSGGHTKTRAKALAKSARNSGKKARVTHSKSHKYTVYTRG